jgi:hypothetical protein
VALAKRLRKLGVPVPGRGYWARVKAGQTPHRPTLSRRKDLESDYPVVSIPPPAQAEADETDDQRSLGSESQAPNRLDAYPSDDRHLLCDGAPSPGANARGVQLESR